MFNFFKRKNKAQEEAAKAADVAAAETEATPAEVAAAAQPSEPAETAGTAPVDTVIETASAAAESEQEQTDVVAAEPATQVESAPAIEPEPIIEAEPVVEPEPAAVVAAEPEAVAVATEMPAEKPKRGFFARIREGLSRTRSGLTDGLANLLLGKKAIDDDLLEELETQLLMADVGVEATGEIMARLTERVSRKELGDSDALYKALIEELKTSLQAVEAPLQTSVGKKPFVILMVGINGVGKTTTIGKLARQYQSQGKSVMLAAGDTFRAAAVEQLQVWGERNKVPVIAQHTGADSASVLFDALQAAQSRNVDVLIADTAGRLHNKDNLMQELEKVVRVMKKLDPEAPHEVMLVLDAGTGQNAINQTRQFLQAVGVTGLTLTKLDGTAKGGVIFALAKQFGIPVRFIGVGEGIEDLRPFQADQFIEALFQRENE
ncbi:signal recognition particle-docking protein FtsY [Oceanobacter mangrovi]|uniref:signal recognition particle-docking protein FtsY n=1 Tax=Oceanobacter mangrovi TaxID=2862510 RepID=UPI001C8EFF1B|nr:signal recognition particle-docking protein FtsY [Oceanobacter mangrovi]